VSRFVRPSSKTLTLANGDTLLVRTRLNAGEERRSLTRMYFITPEGERTLNPLQVGMATIVAFLIDWSLCDDTGARVEIRGLSPDDLEAVLDNLDPDDFKEIKDAIMAHERAMIVERDAEKKRKDGASGSSATPTSPPATDGDTSGSMPSTPMSTT
jgi:hypothetical protein